MENFNQSSIEDFLPQDNIRKYILSNYNLKNANITMIKFKDTDKQRAVYRIDSNNASYCLKKVYFDEKNLLYVYSALEWLYRNNIQVPKLLPTINKHRYVKYNNMLFILTPWVNGEKCDFDNSEHLKLSAKTLGRLHKVSSAFTPIEGSIVRKGLSDYNKSINKHFNQILVNINNAQRYNDKFSKIFLDNLDENMQLAKLSLEISSTINNSELSTSLCHGDYVNKNIIITDDDVCVIDFDKCKFNYSAHDLSYFLRRLLKRETTNWDKSLTIEIIDSYISANTLTASDLKFILSYIAFPQKYWKISRDYYRNIRRCNKNSFILLLEKGTDKSNAQLHFVYEMIKLLEKKYNVSF